MIPTIIITPTYNERENLAAHLAAIQEKLHKMLLDQFTYPSVR